MIYNIRNVVRSQQLQTQFYVISGAINLGIIFTTAASSVTVEIHYSLIIFLHRKILNMFTCIYQNT